MKNISNYNNINSCIQVYEDEIRGIKDEIEMYEYNKKKTKDPEYKSFCDYKIDVRRCHIEELMESVNKLKRCVNQKELELNLL